MIKSNSFNFFSTVLITGLLSISCDDTNPNSTLEKPELSNLSPIGSIDNPFMLTTYEYLGTLRNDSVQISFDYRGSRSSTISIQASLDSGNSWIDVTSISPSTSNPNTYYWSPKDGMKSQYEFCGEKSCRVRVSSGESVLQSDEFAFIGSLPMLLESPKSGETYSVNDTIIFTYTSNSDLTAHIRTFFMYISDNDWTEFFNSTPTEPVGIAGNISKYRSPLILSEHSGKGDEISVMIKDYGKSYFNTASSIKITE